MKWFEDVSQVQTANPGEFSGQCLVRLCPSQVPPHTNPRSSVCSGQQAGGGAVDGDGVGAADGDGVDIEAVVELVDVITVVTVVLAVVGDESVEVVVFCGVVCVV